MMRLCVAHASKRLVGARLDYATRFNKLISPRRVVLFWRAMSQFASLPSEAMKAAQLAHLFNCADYLLLRSLNANARHKASKWKANTKPEKLSMINDCFLSN